MDSIPHPIAMNALKRTFLLCGGSRLRSQIRWQHVKFDNLGLTEKPRVLQFAPPQPHGLRGLQT